VSAVAERLSAPRTEAPAAAGASGGNTAVRGVRLALPAHELKCEDEQAYDCADCEYADEPILVSGSAALGRQEQGGESGCQSIAGACSIRRRTPTHRVGECAAEERFADVMDRHATHSSDA